MSQPGAKDQFYCGAYYMILNSNCEAQKEAKNLKTLQKIEIEAKINEWVI